jgi:hypothetical protein
MPEVARCNTIEVGGPVLCAGSKIEACDQVEQTLKGAIRGRGISLWKSKPAGGTSRHR